jgi:hypothetical protein
MPGPVQNQGPERIQPLDLPKVEYQTVAVGGSDDFGREVFNGGRILGRPATGQSRSDFVTGTLDPGLRLVSQGILRHRPLDA